MPVGGIKEKILAARRAGIEEVILCEKNKKDIEEIDKDYLSSIKVHYVRSVDQVLKLALLDEKVEEAVIFNLDQGEQAVEQG